MIFWGSKTFNFVKKTWESWLNIPFPKIISRNKIKYSTKIQRGEQGTNPHKKALGAADGINPHGQAIGPQLGIVDGPYGNMH